MPRGCTYFFFIWEFSFSTVNYLADNYSENYNISESKFKGVSFALFNFID